MQQSAAPVPHSPTLQRAAQSARAQLERRAREVLLRVLAAPWAALQLVMGCQSVRGALMAIQATLVQQAALPALRAPTARLRWLQLARGALPAQAPPTPAGSAPACQAPLVSSALRLAHCVPPGRPATSRDRPPVCGACLARQARFRSQVASRASRAPTARLPPPPSASSAPPTCSAINLDRQHAWLALPTRIPGLLKHGPIALHSAHGSSLMAPPEPLPAAPAR